MTNIIGLTKHVDGQRVMVNADNISYFQSGADDFAVDSSKNTVTEIMLTGGYLLVVDEDVYEIAERIDADQLADV